MTENHGHTPEETPDRQRAESGVPTVSDEAVRRLTEAVAHLANDPDFFLQGLTDFLLAMNPVSPDRLSDSAVRFLIESGDFTADEWAKTATAVDRGSLQLSTTKTWLLSLLLTISLEEAADFLCWTEDTVRAAVTGGLLHAAEISGRLRFPTWQFNAGPGKLLPGLTEVIRVIAPRWDWQSAAGFMSTPQPELVAEGPKTPAQWLRDGGQVAAVQLIVEASDWS
jgi:hypothetical protein